MFSGFLYYFTSDFSRLTQYVAAGNIVVANLDILGSLIVFSRLLCNSQSCSSV